MSRRGFVGAGLAAAGLTGAGGLWWYRRHADATRRNLTPLAFQYSWYANGIGAGYYAAARNGDYAAEGLDVEIVHGGASIDPVESVLSGRAQVGSAAANLVIRARDAGKPVKAIAAIHQRNPAVFLSLKEKGITRPEDFVGRTISGSRSSLPILSALMNRFDIAPDRYRVVHPTDFNLFDTDTVDIWVGFLFDTRRRMEAQGLEVNELYPDNFGIHFYRNVIFTTEEMIADRSDEVLRFLRATLTGGWQYAVEYPETAGDLAAAYNPDIDREHEAQMMTGFVPLIATGQAPIGWMNADIWKAMVENLARMKVIDPALDPASVHTMRFLEDIYPDGKLAAARGEAGIAQAGGRPNGSCSKEGARCAMS